MTRPKMVKPMIPTPKEAGKSPLERTADLLRTVLQAPKAAIVKPKKALRKHR